MFTRDKEEPNKKFVLEILPHADSDEPNHVGIKLYVQYTAKYPDEICNFRVEAIKGLKDKQLTEIQNLCMSLSEENIGTPSMFTICTEIQEYLVQNNIPCDTSLHDQMKAQKELKARLQRLTFGDETKTDDHTTADVHASEFDQTYKRAKGTAVSKKAFRVWSKRFLKEYRAKKEERFIKTFGSDDRRDKLTGVQIFEQKAKEKLNVDININKAKQNDKTVVVGNVESKQDEKTVVISDESLFLDMDMPDM